MILNKYKYKYIHNYRLGSSAEHRMYCILLSIITGLEKNEYLSKKL
jgi:hypothetical protein